MQSVHILSTFKTNVVYGVITSKRLRRRVLHATRLKCIFCIEDAPHVAVVVNEVDVDNASAQAVVTSDAGGMGMR